MPMIIDDALPEDNVENHKNKAFKIAVVTLGKRFCVNPNSKAADGLELHKISIRGFHV